jgi:hypothetical protein
MRFTSTYITPLLAAGAAAVAIAVAPTAAAAPATASQPSTAQMSCGSVGSGSECITPGNAQINDSPPGVDYYPYGGEGFLLGGFGGFHGGHR